MRIQSRPASVIGYQDRCCEAALCASVPEAPHTHSPSPIV